MGVKFDIECAYNKYGVKVASLKKVLNFITIDSVINDTRVAAYLLATAGAESGYDLQKWESDSACKKGGNSVLYPPCQKAIDYFNTTLYINSRGESVKK